MSDSQSEIRIEPVPFSEVAAALARTQPFAATSPEAYLGVLSSIERVTAPAGALLASAQDSKRFYWIVLSGEARADRLEPDGSQSIVGFARSGEAFGEVPLLTARTHAPIVIRAATDSTLVRFEESDFWTLLACCPDVRKVVLANLTQRLDAYQVEELHRKKLASLGAMAAGLMHELHNPGSAAKRAATHLRENLMRLQEVSLRAAAKPKTQEQLDCMHQLLQSAVHSCQARAMSSLDQADAEEGMSQWLQSAGVENAYTIGPSLAAIGFDLRELQCARQAFEPAGFSDALNWLDALVSSMSQICAIEESISRISDLVMAVKKFAYEGQTANRELDVHDSLQSTLTILGHKLRGKNLSIDKRFDAKPSVIQTRGSALSQVWTNLLDNAADASPENGLIEIATWSETVDGAPWLAVSIADHGPGIPPDVLPRIFEAFFTTKPQGSGTGLGLEIVHGIVTQKFGGAIAVESNPGNTRFIVRLPVSAPAATEPPQPS